MKQLNLVGKLVSDISHISFIVEKQTIFQKHDNVFVRIRLNVFIDVICRQNFENYNL